MRRTKYKALVLALALLITGQVTANAQSKFVCRNSSGHLLVLAELDSKQNTASLTLGGYIAKQITEEFTDKEPGFYNQVTISTTTEGVSCAFRPQRLYFSCAFHRYALAFAESERGEFEFIRLGTNESGTSKGMIYDYADGRIHSIGVYLYKPKSPQQIFFGEEFEPEFCAYE